MSIIHQQFITFNFMESQKFAFDTIIELMLLTYGNINVEINNRINIQLS